MSTIASTIAEDTIAFHCVVHTYKGDVLRGDVTVRESETILKAMVSTLDSRSKNNTALKIGSHIEIESKDIMTIKIIDLKN